MGASASGVRAGSAYVELFATDNKLSQNLNAAAAKFKRFGSFVRGIGVSLGAASAAVVAPLTAIAVKMAESGAAMYQASQRTGVAVEELSALKYAAEQTGTDMEGLEMGFRKMGKALAEAAGGSAEAQQTFAKLGLSVAGLSQMNPEQRFEAVAEALSKISDPSKRAALAMKVFGKTGTSLLPMMENGAAGIEKWKQRAKELGLVSSTEGVKGAAEFELALKDLELTTKKLWSTVAGSIIPILKKKAEVMTGITVKAIAWAKQNKALFATIFKVAAIVGVVGAAVVAFGYIISSVGSAMIGLSAIVGTLVTIFAAVTSPIGLIVAGLFGGAAALLYFTDVGKVAGNFLMGVFRKIYDAIKFVFDNTSTAAGAWSAILAEAGFIVRDAWLSVKQSLMTAWTGFKLYFENLWIDISTTVQDQMQVAAKFFADVWAKAAFFVKGLLIDLKTQFALLQVEIAERSGTIDAATAASVRGVIAKNAADAAGGTASNFSSKLADAKATFDADQQNLQAGYLQKKLDLANKTAKQLAADATATQEAKAANAQEQAELRARLKAAHAAGGEKSLADKFRDILKGVDTPELTRTPQGLGGDMDGILEKISTAGTFSHRAGSLLVGDNSAAQERADRKKMIDQLAAIIVNTAMMGVVS